MKPILSTILLMSAFITGSSMAADKKIVLLAGTPSHPPGAHEHRAGCLLLKSCLDRVPGVTCNVHTNGWPENADAVFADAAAFAVYCDGGTGHPFLKENRLQTLAGLMKKGVGFTCIHYAVEPTKAKGQTEFLDWLGGGFEINWSVNPHWEAEFKELPGHPITRGVTPFKITDEWYFHLRFREGMKGVTPILTAIAPESTMSRPDGEHSGNPAVRESVKRGDPQHVAWACERTDGGRGFGFTGGHFHTNWGDENFRRIVLNGLLWIAKVEVPPDGVQSKITAEDLAQNLDPKGASKPQRKK